MCYTFLNLCLMWRTAYDVRLALSRIHTCVKCGAQCSVGTMERKRHREKIATARACKACEIICMSRVYDINDLIMNLADTY